MKKVGLIGGLSWQSSVDYYSIINEESNKRLGGKHTVESIMYSTNLGRKYGLVDEGKMDVLAEEFTDIAQSLEKAGADVIIICSNTMHAVFDEVQRNVNIPMIHIVDATAQAIQKRGMKKVALLGTTYTMTQPFYKEKLKNKYGIETIVPSDEQMTEIMHVIEEELNYNVLRDKSRKYFISVINELKEQGAEGVILGCTEIPMLVKQKDSTLPVFDTTRLHALAALDYAMEE